MTKSQIEEMHSRFVGGPHRRPQTCLEPEGMAHLWKRLEERNPKKILDLGSGLSSWVIRTWKKDNKGVQVVTTDLGQKWLDICRDELIIWKLPTAKMYLHDEWAARDHKRGYFDLIFCDIGDTKARKRRAKDIVSRLKPTGLIILDDWHMPHYNGQMQEILEGEGMKVTALRDTIDRYGRYMAEAEFAPLSAYKA